MAFVINFVGWLCIPMAAFYDKCNKGNDGLHLNHNVTKPPKQSCTKQGWQDCLGKWEWNRKRIILVTAKILYSCNRKYYYC